MIAAVNIERKPNDQDRGSVLFLDTTGVLEGAVPVVIDRVNVGINAGARPEGLRSSDDGRFIWVSLGRDGGSFARFELAE